MKWFRFPDDRMTVNGLAWFEEEKPSLRRLPRRLRKTFPKQVWDLAQQPAGGRIRFRTDSTRIGLRAKSPKDVAMSHMTLIAQAGFDLYVEGRYLGSIAPNEFGNMQPEWQIGPSDSLRDITIHLPLYRSVKIASLGLDRGSRVAKPRPFALPKPVVYYGTSITQGGCASNPGLTYQDVVARMLNLDFINLGFSGAGKGELALARAINEIPASCIVLDHWGNIGLGLGENLPLFVGILREKHPRVPIIVTSPFYLSWELTGDETWAKVRVMARDFVRRRRREGDERVFFLDGLKMISREQTFATVDGVHANSLGFYLMGRAFAPFLKKVLGL